MIRVPRPYHLLEQDAGLDLPHEKQDLQRLDVGASGDHVHRDSDARVVRVAEAGDQVFGRVAGGAVGDLLAEVVPLAELLAQDAHDVLGVAVVLGEDQRLGHFGAPGEDLGEEPVPEGPDDGADLPFRRQPPGRAGVGVVVQVFVQLLPALRRVSLSRLPT